MRREETNQQFPARQPLVDDFEESAPRVWPYVSGRTTKERITVRLDRDILAYFRQDGRGYQTRINAILRDHMKETATERQ